MRKIYKEVQLLELSKYSREVIESIRWCRKYYVDTVGRNKKIIEQYIKD